mmetsp:Transcript_256/g.250  ORF Transcript_256/g.250 Transcript_256/m.250 type:complete len:80 (-) Transcript_256:216-455(-)
MSEDCRLGYKKNALKKTSIYSGSFGHHKLGINYSQEDFKTSEDQYQDNLNEKSSENKLNDYFEADNDKVKWIPNDAYDN